MGKKQVLAEQTMSANANGARRKQMDQSLKTTPDQGKKASGTTAQKSDTPISDIKVSPKQYDPIPHAQGTFNSETRIYSISAGTPDSQVYSGDTLYSIARRFDTTVDAIMELNHLESTELQPGQLLVIPAPRVYEQEQSTTTTTDQSTTTTTDQSTTPTTDQSTTTTTDQSTTPTTDQSTTTTTDQSTTTTTDQSTTTTTDSQRTETDQTPTDVTTDLEQTDVQQESDKVQQEVQQEVDTDKRLTLEQAGDRVMNAMKEMNVDTPDIRDDTYNYPEVPTRGGVLDNGMGYLNPDFWLRVTRGNSTYCTFILKEDVKPADAIRAAFAGPTRLECLTSAEMVLYRALLDLMGDEAFNEYFKWNSESDPGLEVNTTGTLPARLNSLLFYPQVNGIDDLIKGDWIYYKNDPRYLQKHPAGLWQGENAFYEGNGTFSGLGLTNMTEQDFYTSMKAHFDENPSSRDKADSRYDPSLRRAHDGEPVGFLWNSVTRINIDKVNEFIAQYKGN